LGWYEIVFHRSWLISHVLNVARAHTLPFDKTGVNEIGRKWLFMFLFRDGYNVSILPGLRDMTVAIRGVQNLFDWKREKIRVLLQNPINI
jgi:hypothetical protein